MDGTGDGRPNAETGPDRHVIAGFLDRIAGDFAANEAIVFRDPLAGNARVRWTYDDLRTQSRRVASALIAAGAGKGTRVGILLGNRPEFAAAFFGTAMIGAIAVTLSTFSTRDELEQLLPHADVAILLTQTSIARKPTLETLVSLCPDIATAPPGEIHAPQFPFLRRVVALGDAGSGGESWEDFLSAGERIAPELVEACAQNVHPSDEALVIYTSGTTDRPKGVIHTHRTVVRQFHLQAGHYGRTARTRIWSPFPMFWTAGLSTVLGSTLAVGGCWVAQEVFEPGESLRLMAEEKVTEPYPFPSHTAALAEHPNWLTTDLSAMRCVQGNYEFAKHPRVNPDPNWYMLSAYGLSETLANAASHTTAVPAAIQTQSSGRPQPGFEFRIIDPQSGRPLAVAEQGEICLRGPSMMVRYVKTFREDCFDADGYFHTGDLGFIDPDGFVHWTGRLKSMIKTGGANVSPAEVEVAAARLGTMKLCRVVGIPDARLGEMVILCAVPADEAQPSEKEVISALQQKLASYKVPKRVLFFRLEDYPMTPSGKVKLGDLRDIVMARLAQS